ncbi:hypothetical protein ONZ45_g14360 [Pleurotus djamor]|nr:hypothetical protein ONZ45_g14360 [Pleurotus djamor]
MAISSDLMFTDPTRRPPLDESLYSLTKEEEAFLKKLTGIQDDAQLKRHIIAIQFKAYNVYGYPCIRRFAFLNLGITRLPSYHRVLELARVHTNPIFLDMACCFGNDLRKAIVDGWPAERAVASDLHQEFWNAGHQLFNSTPESFPIPFIPGDIFDSKVLDARGPVYKRPSTPPPDLKHLKSLTSLQGHVSAIHASWFFHLFDERKQFELAKRMASLLSPRPGSVIFGVHGGLPEKGIRLASYADVEHRMFCHSPKSWEELWNGQIFAKGTAYGSLDNLYQTALWDSLFQLPPINLKMAHPAVPPVFTDADKLPLDESFYSLDLEESTFFKSLTGIQDDSALKSHILTVQTEAYEVFGYPCIRGLAFTKLKISRLPRYKDVLQLAYKHDSPILLDMACCFGNDIRKAVVDGWPLERAIASDLRQEFWDAGHKLFRSTAESFPVPFLPGDIFDPSFLQPCDPFYELPTTPPPALSSIASLTPLLGHVSAMHVSALFHLFNEEKQLEIAKLLAPLLSPVPGSIIFGSHGGLPEKGVHVPPTGSRNRLMFCHSPKSWEQLWDGQVFRKGTVKVVATLKEFSVADSENTGGKWYNLDYSITRL